MGGRHQLHDGDERDAGAAGGSGDHVGAGAGGVCCGLVVSYWLLVVSSWLAASNEGGIVRARFSSMRCWHGSFIGFEGSIERAGWIRGRIGAAVGIEQGREGVGGAAGDVGTSSRAFG